MLSTGVSRSRLDLQERLLDKPIFVRLKFLGLGVPGGQPVPAKYTVRDVQAETGVANERPQNSGVHIEPHRTWERAVSRETHGVCSPGRFGRH